MKKLLSLSLLLASCSQAADLSLGLGWGESQSSFNVSEVGEESLVAMVVDAGYRRDLSEDSGMYALTSLMLSPEKGSPHIALVSAGGLFKSSSAPAWLRMGVAGKYESSANAEGNTEVTTGLLVGAGFQLMEDITIDGRIVKTAAFKHGSEANTSYSLVLTKNVVMA